MCDENYRENHHYAISDSGELMHICDAHERDGDFFCPYCKCKMIKKCGEKNAWHFAHDWRYENDDKRECSHESYLHFLAKLKLKDWFEKSESIILYYDNISKCKFIEDCKWKKTGDRCATRKLEKVDLKKCLTDCQLEKTVDVNGDQYRPDLLWRNPSKPKNDIFVEIKVTHECSQEKKNSSARIIEFEINSEEDIENIVSSNIVKESPTVRFYGFKPKASYDPDIEAKHTLKKIYLLRVWKSYCYHRM